MSSGLPSIADIHARTRLVAEVPIADLGMCDGDAVPDAQRMQDGVLAFDEPAFAKLPRFQTDRGVVGQQKNRLRLIFCPN